MYGSLSDNEKDERKNEEERKRFLTYAMETTTFNGLPKVYFAPKIYFKVMWIVLFCAATAIMIVLIVDLTRSFLTYPVKTDIKLGYSALQLPAVTICNENSLRRSMATELPCDLQKLLELTGEDVSESCDFWNETQDGTDEDDEYDDSSDNDDYDYDEDEMDDYCEEEECGDYDTASLYKSYTDVYMERRKILFTVNKMKMSSRIKFGHQKEDFILKCSFRGAKCNLSQIITFQSSRFGNCFTFPNTDGKVLGSGSENGLELYLNLETDEYMDKLHTGYGVRVQVHETGTIPLPTSSGISVSGGQESSLALKLVNVTRLGGKYGDCNDGSEFKKTYKMKYTDNSCRQLCVSNATIKKCGCYPSTAAELINYLPSKYSFCEGNKTFCEDVVKETFVRNEQKMRDCACSNPCSMLNYELRVTSRQWPSSYELKNLEAEVCKKNSSSPKCDPGMYYMSERRLSFAKIHIYYETLNYQSVKESPFYEMTNFLSNIGGTMGLMMGLSLLSLAEVVEIVIECLIFVCRRLPNFTRISPVR